MVLHEAPLPPEKLLAEDPGLEEARLKLALATLKNECGARLPTPSTETVEIHAMGRGTTSAVSSR